MINTIREIIDKAIYYDEYYNDRDAALDFLRFADNIMLDIELTFNAPSDWHDIREDLYEEFKDNKLVVSEVFYDLQEGNNENS